MESCIINFLEEHGIFLSSNTIANYSKLPQSDVARELIRLAAENKIRTRHIRNRICYAR